MLHCFDLQEIESQQQVHDGSPHNKLYDKQQVLQQVGQLVAQQVHHKSTASCMQQSASLTASRTTCCRTDQQLIEVTESDTMCKQANRSARFVPTCMRPSVWLPRVVPSVQWTRKRFNRFVVSFRFLWTRLTTHFVDALDFLPVENWLYSVLHDEFTTNRRRRSLGLISCVCLFQASDSRTKSTDATSSKQRRRSQRSSKSRGQCRTQ